jgi:hypothetical protein
VNEVRKIVAKNDFILALRLASLRVSDGWANFLKQRWAQQILSLNGNHFYHRLH